mmetsp:Transcript_3397/g.5938  ORF Transcript_3397/g.5938 Transcript_3397/m.5938 type:complete len:232 (+) Transcript_3397:868-1563(+)
MVQQSVGLGAEGDDLGDQQRLPGDAIRGHLRLQFFVNETFVGGVLIDQHDAERRLCNDVILMHLRARRAERAVTLDHRLIDAGRGRGPMRCGFVHLPDRREAPLLSRAVHLVDPRRIMRELFAFPVNRLERLHRRIRDGRRRPVPGFGQSVAQPRHDQGTCHRRFPEPHLGFSRMHVHIDPFGRAADEQDGRRVPVARKHVHVSCPQCADQKLVPHRAPVDEEELRHSRAA